MSKKDELTHAPEDFQLDRKAQKIDVGFPGNAFVDKIFEFFNGLDLNNDHKSDVAQIAPYVVRMMPFVMAIAPLVNVDGVKKWLFSHPEFFHNAEEAAKQIEAAAAVAAEAAAKLAPKV